MKAAHHSLSCAADLSERSLTLSLSHLASLTLLFLVTWGCCCYCCAVASRAESGAWASLPTSLLLLFVVVTPPPLALCTDAPAGPLRLNLDAISNAHIFACVFVSVCMCVWTINFCHSLF